MATEKNFRYQHILSNVEDKAPTSAQILDGEIAVNTFAGSEKMFIKNASGNIVSFSSDNAIEKMIIYNTSGKVDTTTFETYSGNVDTAINSKLATSDFNTYSGAVDTEISNALSAKQDVLTEGRAIDITNNVISLDLPISAGTGTNSIIEGNGTTASGDSSHAEGRGTQAIGNYSHAEGRGTQASGNYSHTEGESTTASGERSHAEGNYTTANGGQSHAEGSGTTASGVCSHAEGRGTQASGNYSHTEGESTKASGERSHAEGINTQASGNSSHAEGTSTIASGECSHAEGFSTKAIGGNSHAEGEVTTASGYSSHAEGHGTKANGNYSHAEGASTIAIGLYSHAEGTYTTANNNSEHASGRYNISSSASTEFGNSGNTLFSVGNGTEEERHNAFEIRQNGDIYITSGGTITSQMIKLQDSLGVDLSNYYTKSETSGATEISNALSEKVNSATYTGHTADTTIHLTSTEKGQLHTHSNMSALDSITGNVGTMAYENVSSYSSATEVNTALGNKADKADAVVSAVTVSSDLSNVTCPDSITGSSKSGAQAIVIYENGGTTTDYTITVSTNYKSPDGSQISITCAKGGYCEVNYINVNGTIYARGA